MALLESHEVDWLQALEPEIAGWLQLSAGRLRSLAAVDREAITELRSLVDSYEERRAAAAQPSPFVNLLEACSDFRPRDAA